MNKLAHKLTRASIGIILIVTLLSLIINTLFIEKYYLYTKKRTLDSIYQELENKTTEILIEETESLEETYNIRILCTSYSPDVDKFNDAIQTQLRSKNIFTSRFWITPKKVEQLQANGSVNLIYNQGNLNYSVLMKLFLRDDLVFALTLTIPHVTETIAIINQFTLMILIGALILTLILMRVFTNRIVKPLSKLSEVANNIAHLDFQQIHIDTNDEIEELSHSVNLMSHNLKRSHQELSENNQYLKNLIGDISHELKTPISIIGAYGSGIEDGMDDGSFIEVILEQNKHMADLVEKLLFLSRLHRQPLHYERFNLSQLFDQALTQLTPLMTTHHIQCITHITPDLWVYGDRDNLQSVATNLITNAIKYTSDSKIDIKLGIQGDFIDFNISNAISPDISNNLQHIWQPFYVLEESRNKHLSGTGLGLAIVKAILEKHSLDYGYHINDHMITFYIKFLISH